ncbi:beta-1,3-galactosyl-O-glycosyl-glycoprotein beta-1,6-N-acetylglucosaminyltransferase-like [Gigantopelta aegis]|uniref:beta-1,3-galactosyl-O-glycosyl-glycoprotein beta-1,6-N-acetylglucosaminyltransferase-like n=1 Tax=Gigantopelta aegis TaxID=1735272 RepID=UPI001B88A45D|nr:beta-1,3-galactosyl-O-glycosyl-glycoprotein beta-1,6-N-acetylglucosaminyltransferase-like [Gigantopelta aegis]XP_041363212.1 beta-1,3-galactosyl-O-glycosyl-glycoprotein beta-1,6-N-acetylglucosaminyltransferase-like [Gigantopelta aegis]
MSFESIKSVWKMTTLFVLVLVFQSVLCFYMVYMVDIWKIRYALSGQRDNCETQPTRRTVQTLPTESVSFPAKSANRTDNSQVSAVCSSLIAGDASEMNRSVDYMQRHPRRHLMPEAYPDYTKNCSAFVKQAGFITKAASKEEEDFPIAFSIMVYKHAEQVERLLRAIYRPYNVYCVHVDKKSPDVFMDAMKSIARCLPNVFIAPISLDVQWGEYTVLEADLICMDSLLQRKVLWKYFINLTGQEFPLKTNYELVQILKRYRGANDIAGGYKGTYKYRWKDIEHVPYGIIPKKGPVHITASRGFVEHIRRNKKALDFLEWVKGTDVPDETYFASMNYNPHLKIPGTYKGDVSHHRPAWFTRLKIWEDWAKPCFGKFVHHICIFGVGDLPRLTTIPHLFANKFHYDFQPLVLDCLQEWYFKKVEAEQNGRLQFDTSMYKRKLFYFDKRAW